MLYLSAEGLVTLLRCREMFGTNEGGIPLDSNRAYNREVISVEVGSPKQSGSAIGIAK